MKDQVNEDEIITWLFAVGMGLATFLGLGLVYFELGVH